MSKDVVDAQQVDIPVPPCARPTQWRSDRGLPFGANPARAPAGSDGGTQEGRSTGRWLSRGKHVEGPVGKSAGHNLEMRCRTASGEVTDPMLPRKASSELTRCPYPKPTQVGT